MKIEIEGIQLLFTSAYILCLMDAILIGYSSIGLLPGASRVSRCLCIGALLLVLIKLVSDGFYSLEYLFIMILLGALFLLAYIKSGYNHILYFLIVFLGMRNVQSKHILKVDFGLKIILSLFIISSSLSGVIENYITHRTGESALRYSLGFNHPNTLASIVLSLIVEEAFLSGRKGNGFYTILIWLIDSVLYLVTDNRTAVLLIAIFPILLLLQNRDISKSDVNISKIKILLGTCGYPLATICSFILMRNARKNIFFATCDRWFSNRFFNANVIYDRYGISLLGQKVNLVSVRTARMLHSSIALLDISYLRILIQAGLLVLLTIGALYCFALNKMVKTNNYLRLLVVLLFLLFGMYESGSNNVFINFSLIFIIEEFYKNERLISKEVEGIYE